MHNNPENSIKLLLDFLRKQEITESEQNFQQVKQNPESMIHELVQQFYSIEDEVRKRSFIRNIHARLVWEIDYFTEIKEPDAKENSKKEHKKLSDNQNSILIIFESLHTFILENFSEYLDWQQRLPINFRKTFTIKILERFNKLSFSENESDSILLEKVKTSVENKLKRNKSGVTYGLTIYLNKVSQEIEKIKAVNKQYSHSINFRDIFIAYNFNSLSVVHHLISTIVENIKKIESVKDKIECLNLWSKQVNQIPYIHNYTFIKSRESVRQFLSNWIQEEIQFYEKSLLLFSDSYPAPVFVRKQSNFKIETELPVTQIAYFIRLFMDCGIFKKTNVREIINFLSEHMRSKKRENISSESFRLKYYNIEESTREEVRKLLFQMLDKSAHPL